MLDETYRLLDDCGLSYDEIAKRADVNIWWLRKFAIRQFKDPGTRRVEKLYRFLSEHSETAA